MDTAVTSPRLTENIYTQEEVQATYRSIVLRVLPLLIVCYIVAMIDRSNIGFAKLQFVRQLGFTEAIYGVGAGTFAIGYVVFEIPSNLYLAKYGVRRTLWRIMILWGLFCAAMALMKTPTQYYLFRCCLGAGEAGLFPGILLYLTFWVPAARRARFTSYFMCAIPVSGFISGPLSGLIMHSLDGAVGLRGWQWLFLLEGLPACLIGGVAFFYLSDYPSRAKWLTERQKAIVARDLEQDHQNKASKSHHSVKLALRDPDVYLLVCFSFAMFVSTSGIYFWLPTIIRNSGVKDVLYVGLLSSIPFIIGFAAQLLIARHSDRAMERRWHVALCGLTAAIGWGMMPLFARNPAASIVLLIVTCVGTYGAMGPFWTMPSAVLSGTAAAAGIALVTSTGAIGTAVSPVIVGWIATRTGSLAGGLVYQGCTMLLGGIAILLVRGTRKTSA